MGKGPPRHYLIEYPAVTIYRDERMSEPGRAAAVGFRSCHTKHPILTIYRGERMNEPRQVAGVGFRSCHTKHPIVTIYRGERMSEPWRAAGVGPPPQIEKGHIWRHSNDTLTWTGKVR
jgi:hypothetical protein